MIHNETIDLLLGHRSIRSYTNEPVSQEMIDTICAAGQQAAFAHQCYSIVISRDAAKHAFNAPIHFLICIDVYKLELILQKRGWQRTMCDLSTLLFSMQDAAYAAQNMVIAAESMGLGTCYLGFVPFAAEQNRRKWNLPDKVMPLVGLVVGHPAQNPPVRPRFPKEFTCHETHYRHPDEILLNQAMRVMDEGYLAQDYYRNAGYMVPLEDGREEQYSMDDYSWTEHISRKLGQWNRSTSEMINLFEAYGFSICDKEKTDEK